MTAAAWQRWTLGLTLFCLGGCATCFLGGCATMKESDTARTGMEQLLISSAADRAMDKVDLRPLGGAKVFLETKYLDCVDKNYIIVSLHQRLMRVNCTLMDKPEDAQVIMEVASGSVGTDGTELFVGVPKVPLPAPSPVSIPEIPIFKKSKSMGTAKLCITAYDATTKRPVINGAPALARADAKNWNLLGIGPVQSGSVPTELAAATGQSESVLSVPSVAAQPATKR